MSMVSWFHTFRGFIGYLVSMVSFVSWFHRFSGVTTVFVDTRLS